jgi:hypothetical protein
VKRLCHICCKDISNKYSQTHSGYGFCPECSNEFNRWKESSSAVEVYLMNKTGDCEKNRNFRFLYQFLMWFRESCEKYVSLTVEEMIEIYLDKKES